jgi:hypothetical protein
VRLVDLPITKPFGKSQTVLRKFLNINLCKTFGILRKVLGQLRIYK